MYLWNWNTIYTYCDVFIKGGLMTLGITVVTIFFGTIIGIFLALIIRRSSNPVFSLLAKVYVEIFRALPILVLLIWVYYVLPLLSGWHMSAFFAAALTLSVNLSAYVAEAVRGGIESIPKSQFESGIVLGLNHAQTMIRIILPQAARNIMPNLLSLYITQLKNSSLTSIIAVNELLHSANILISNTFRPLEIYTTVAFVYLVMILPLVIGSRLLENRLKRNIKTA